MRRIRPFCYIINNTYVIAGEPITMVALGGSITCGQGGRDVPSYIEQVFQWINATFPHPGHTFINSCKVWRLLPHCPPTYAACKCTQQICHRCLFEEPAIICIPAPVMWQGGEGSTAAGLCFDAKVPRTADFITMEFTLNDADYAVPFAVEYLHSPLDWPRDMLSDNRSAHRSTWFPPS